MKAPIDSKGDAILIMSLKRELDAALKEISEKDVEVNNLKKCFKVTKFKEIQEERKAYMIECQRLGRIVWNIKNTEKLLRSLSKRGNNLRNS